MVCTTTASRYNEARKLCLDEYRRDGERQAYSDACRGLFDGVLEEIVDEYERNMEPVNGFPLSALEQDFCGMDEYWRPILAEMPFLAEDDDRGILSDVGEAYMKGWVAGARRYLTEAAERKAKGIKT